MLVFFSGVYLSMHTELGGNSASCLVPAFDGSDQS